MLAPRVGAFVLETLTTGMYTNPLDAVRECIQNACDSILAAERASLIAANEGRVVVHINSKTRSLSIEDNGIGVASEQVPVCLLDIGMSRKLLETDAGFRGIGRLAAIAYCERLEWQTKYAGESRETIVSVDCSALRQHLAPDTARDLELSDVMAKCTTVASRPANSPEHYFRVRMYSLTESADAFLDEEILETYLAQVAPVDYNHAFLFAPTIAEWTHSKGIMLPRINVIIRDEMGNERFVFKPYKTRHTTSRRRGGNEEFRITGLKFLPEDFGPGSEYWLWYAEIPLLGTIGDEASRGLRLRKNNIALGANDNPVAELFAQNSQNHRRFSGWTIGEIHLLSSEVIPNARRDGLEQNEAWLRISGELRGLFRGIAQKIQEASQQRNSPVVKTVDSAERFVSALKEETKAGLVSHDAKDERTLKLGTTRKELESIVRKATAPPGTQEKAVDVLRQISDLEKTFDSSEPLLRNRLKSTLSRRERQLIVDICNILEETLDAQTYACARDAILRKYGVA